MSFFREYIVRLERECASLLPKVLWRVLSPKLQEIHQRHLLMTIALGKETYALSEVGDLLQQLQQFQRDCDKKDHTETADTLKDFVLEHSGLNVSENVNAYRERVISKIVHEGPGHRVSWNEDEGFIPEKDYEYVRPYWYEVLSVSLLSGRLVVEKSVSN